MDVFTLARKTRRALIEEWLAIPLPEDRAPGGRKHREFVAEAMSNEALVAAILRDQPAS